MEKCYNDLEAEKSLSLGPVGKSGTISALGPECFPRNYKGAINVAGRPSTPQLSALIEPIYLALGTYQHG